jgi:hypothetical protein
MSAVEAAINKHRLAVLTRDSIEGHGPEYDAAVKAASDVLQELVETPCGSDSVFFRKIAYLDDHISTVDQLDDEFCCVTDAVSAYLVERGVRAAALRGVISCHGAPDACTEN